MKHRQGRWMCLAMFTLMLAVPFTGWAASDDVVAKVNGEPITEKYVQRELTMYAQQLKQQGKSVPEDQKKAMRSNAIDKLIDRELLYQKGVEMDLKPEPEAVEVEVEKVRKRFPNEDAYEKGLEQMGITEDMIRANIHQGIVIRDLVQKEIEPKVQVTDAEVQKFYEENQQFFKKPEEVKASHILVKVDPEAGDGDKKKAMDKIKDVEKQVDEGGDFGELAKEYSEGPSAPKGGDLGFFKRGQMVKPFEDAAFALAVGDVSDIVETRFGYHLIKVTDKTPEGTVELKDAEERIRNYLKQNRTVEELNKYVAELKKDAKIERME